MRLWLSRILILGLLTGLGLVAADPALAATAGKCQWKTVLVTNGGVLGAQYKRTQVCPAGVTPSSSTPAGGTSQPPCDVKSASPATFCWGSSPCYIKDISTPYAPPATAPPTAGAEWQVRMCLTGAGSQPSVADWVGTAQWVGQARKPPPLVDQAREASGLIVLPKGTLVFNPPTRTLVNVDTWFWAERLSGRELRGTSAFGLVAVATPGRLEVTPGDGSAPLSCEWVTTKSDTCSYPYRHSSVGGSVVGPDGRPAYQASARATWTLRFEVNGVPTEVPGAPTALPGPQMTTAVVVDEVQTLVTEAR
jgi:hypothetical protein